MLVWQLETECYPQGSKRKQNHEESQGDLMVSGFIEHFIMFGLYNGRDCYGNGIFFSFVFWQCFEIIVCILCRLEISLHVL